MWLVRERRCSALGPARAAGGVLAARQEIKQFPTRTNQIPRHIPAPHWASHPLVLVLAAGLLPFGTIFVELYFAMTSIWQVCQLYPVPCTLFSIATPARTRFRLHR